ncbi:MAG: DUF167 domain-containing protein [Dehalococcoidia bacterium]|nr:DUF167 domain-containing protein [Dehalococcoidia bacterium]
MGIDLPTPIEIAVRVVPGASKNEVAGMAGGTWKVRLTAPPTEGRANRALIEFLADKLGLNRSQVTLRRGQMRREKAIAICGLSAAEIAKMLAKK